jgi:hypothetical protein
VGWVAAGGGFSHVFSKPGYQNVLPAGSNTGANVNNMRGVPDVGMEASSRTGVLVYDASQGGWFIVGGTSVASPTFAAVVAIAVRGRRRSRHLSPRSQDRRESATPNFFDVTPATTTSSRAHWTQLQHTGWDPVTGLARRTRRSWCLTSHAAVTAARQSRGRASSPAPIRRRAPGDLSGARPIRVSGLDEPPTLHAVEYHRAQPPVSRSAARLEGTGASP